jgi:ectoine hydroxylase-related dioxygenase (phytanoyl-CoA dioxygenase family)
MDDTSYNLHDDETGVVTALDFNPNDISINIECNPGDAVIMRGDLLHKTQDQKDKRLAVSIRCYQSDTILTKEKFDVTCEYKQRMINNSTLFKKISSKYEQNPTLSVSEVLE